MLNMIWIPTSLLILLKVHSLTGECTSPSPGFVECISVDEEEIMSFMKGFPYRTHLKIVDSVISRINIRVYKLTIKNSWVGTYFPGPIDRLHWHRVMPDPPLERVLFLDLSFNKISRVNNLVSTGLSGLIMHHNRIESLDGYELCYGWGSTSTLKTLDLSHNRIKIIYAVTCMELTVLNVSHNLIEGLSTMLANLELVEIVDLSYNKLEYVNANEIVNLRNLKIFNLSHNDIQYFQYKGNMNPAFSCICANILHGVKCSSVEKEYDLLDLSSNRLNPSGEIFVNGDCNNEGHLKTISFENNDLKDLNFLLSNKSRKIRGNSLIFRNNKISKLYPYNFEGFTLKKLDLSLNEIRFFFPHTFGKAEVHELLLDHNNITSLDPSTFIGLSDLVRLNISFNPLVGVIEDGAFYGLNGLVHLNLSHNMIWNLTKNAFVGLKKLKMLDLSFNNLTGEESIFPIGIFKDLVELTHLHLQHNRIIKFHTGEFSNLRNLRFLNLSHNQLTFLDLHLLFPLRKLEVLDINSNHVIEFDYVSIMEHLSSLKMIGIGENKWRCRNLPLMLKGFEQRGVNYREISRLEFDVVNIEGICCVHVEKIGITRLKILTKVLT